MKKFVMILAILAMAGAGVVGLLNKEDLKKVTDELASLRDEVKDATEKLGEAEDKRDAATEKEVQAKDARNQAAAAVEGVKQEMKKFERSLEDVSAELKKVEIEQKEIDLAIQTAFPDGNIKTSEDLTMTLTMLQEDLSKEQAKKTAMNASMAEAAQAKQVEVEKVKKEEQYQMDRVKKLALNGLVATVIAVNKEWGFVMVNAGRQHGVAADSALLVKRGNTRIARLRIVNLEDTSVVADVVEESVVRGIDVQPGDKVIFENAR